MTDAQQQSAANALRYEAQRMHAAARLILADGDNVLAGLDVLRKAFVNLEITLKFINEQHNT